MTLQDTNTALHRYLGAEVLHLLDQPGVTDLKTTEDGRLLSKISGRWQDTGLRMAPERVLGFLNAAAHHGGELLNESRPEVAVQLPAGKTGLARLQGFRPPLTPVPMFVLRTKGRSFTLDELTTQGVLLPTQAEPLRQALAARQNILVIGGTGTGKTTFLEALLRELVQLDPHRHLMILQDTPELTPGGNVTKLFTLASPPRTLADLVRFTLRSAPDNIIVGEIRGAEALPFLDALTTGHPGGLATLHASSPEGACARLGRLIQRNGVPPDPELVADGVDVIAHLQPGEHHPRLVSLVRIAYANGIFTSTPL